MVAAIARGALGLARRGLVLEAELEQPLDDVEERPEAVAGRADAIGTHQRGIERGDVGLDHALGDTRREEVEGASGVRAVLDAVAAGAWNRGSRAQIGSHQHRLEDAGGGTGGGQALVAARRHPRKREGRQEQPPREGVDLGHVIERIAPHLLGIAEVRRVDLRAGNVDAGRAGDAEVTSDILEAVAREIARDEIVAADRVERVDELAPGDGEARSPRA